ncbi:hypothetical protein [Suttonella ornithocola]|nr:hypothetical protein [Suttonella ornithocola]
MVRKILRQSALLIYRHGSGYILIIRRSFDDCVWEAYLKKLHDLMD